MTSSRMQDAGITETVERLRNGESAAALVEATLARIDEVEDKVNAFITITADHARNAAEATDKAAAAGKSLGPLHGVTVAIKDNIDTAGILTSAGSAVLDSRIPSTDATVIRRLAAAGAIMVGKANLHEFAWGATTENPRFGPTRNPWDLTRNAGGSSGGSGAAVSAGECMVALGTDTGGSVRIPAALNGVSGLRPTIGRVSNAGVFPLAWSMDTVGPLARTVRDVAIVHRIIAGHDQLDPTTSQRPVPVAVGPRGLEGVKIGILRDFTLERIEAGVRQAVEGALATLEEAGATVLELELPGVRSYYEPWLIIHTVEPSAVHRRLLADHRDEYGADVRALLSLGQIIPATDYLLAQRHRRTIRKQIGHLFNEVDAIITPTFASIAPHIGAHPLESAGALVNPSDERQFFTGLPSLVGSPALSVPCGFSEGMPVGMQIIGKPWNEEGILGIGMAFQEITEWHNTVAPLH